ncbi:DUF2207 domain-containing protein [Blastococcus sp. SYSU D00820]
MATAQRPAGTVRRTVDLVLLAVVALAVGIGTFVAAATAAEERVARLWVAATVQDDGSARVVEVVDYDFGSDDRHGIYRDVPGLRTDEPVTVTSPDAPDDVFVSTAAGAPRIRIGDASQTVDGRHRYVIEYTLDGVAPGGALAWDAVGTGWQVPIDRVEVHVVAPAALGDGDCAVGTTGSTDACTIGEAAPGHLVARVEELAAGEGVTVTATAGAALAAAPAVPDPPRSAPDRSGVDPIAPAALAGGLTLLLALATARVLRRAGRERVPASGIPVVAAPGEEARVDLAELGTYATPSATLPAGLSAAQGGVLLAGAVHSQHQAAWLLEQAAAGVLELESPDGGSSKRIVVTRRAPGEDPARRILDAAFRGRGVLVLGSYDKDFAGAWRSIGTELRGWQRRSGLWDAAADRRARRIRSWGVVAGLAGIVLALYGASFAADSPATCLALATVAGVLCGLGWAGAISGWELKVLTPEGSAAWLQVESLRQFLATAPREALLDEALASGQVERYTAWAVALGQADRWATVPFSRTASGGGRYHHPAHHAVFAPVFVSSCTTASTSPSSSSSSGGSSSVGGGAGGGGGGSW